MMKVNNVLTLDIINRLSFCCKCQILICKMSNPNMQNVFILSSDELECVNHKINSSVMITCMSIQTQQTRAQLFKANDVVS